MFATKVLQNIDLMSTLLLSRRQLWQLTSALLMLIAIPVSAADQPWFAFTQQDLIGFKDARGKVMIQPTLSGGITIARRFDHIIAAGEHDGQSFRTYYLLKDGRQIGQNSLYMFDNAPDCESEGTIRFRDRHQDKVGFFNGDGQVQIAAQFDDARPLRNGVALALRGARRMCFDGEGVPLDRCEHLGWQGGQNLLIDRHGKTLVEGVDIENFDAFDWYSLVVMQQPSTDPRRVSFKGVDGRYYSFVDIEKEFTVWFTESFLPHLDSRSLQANSFHTVRRGVAGGPLKNYTRASGASMIKQYGSTLHRRLSVLKVSGEYGVSIESSSWPFEPDHDPQYFDGCANFAHWKTPMVSVMENWNRGSFEPAKHASFNFIRTPDGYRLLSFSLPAGQ